MATVRTLIEQLRELKDLDQPIVYQFVLADHTDLDTEQFDQVADYLMDNDQFGEESSELFSSWISEAMDVILDAQEQDEDD